MEKLCLFFFSSSCIIIITLLLGYCYKLKNKKSVIIQIEKTKATDVFSHFIFILLLVGSLIFGLPIMYVIGNDLPSNFVNSGIYYLLSLLFHCSVIIYIYNFLVKGFNKLFGKNILRLLDKNERSWDMLISMLFYVVMAFGEENPLFATVFCNGLSIIIGRFVWIDLGDGIGDEILSFTKIPFAITLGSSFLFFLCMLRCIRPEFPYIIFAGGCTGILISSLIFLLIGLKEIIIETYIEYIEEVLEKDVGDITLLSDEDIKCMTSMFENDKLAAEFLKKYTEKLKESQANSDVDK